MQNVLVQMKCTQVPRRLTLCSHCREDCGGSGSFKQQFTREIGFTTEIKTTQTCTLCHRKKTVQGHIWMAPAAHVCSLITSWLRLGGLRMLLLDACREEICLWHSQSWNNWLQPLLVARKANILTQTGRRNITWWLTQFSAQTRIQKVLCFLPKTRDSRKWIK